MSYRDIKPVTPGGEVSTQGLIDLAQTSESQGEITGSGNIDVQSGQSGIVITGRLPIEFWARITERSGGAYGYEAQVDAPGVVWSTDEDGIHSTTSTSELPAYEVNGNIQVPNGSVVRMYRGLGDYFLFSYCCSTNLLTNLDDRFFAGADNQSHFADEEEVAVAGVRSMFAFWMGGVSHNEYWAGVHSLLGRWSGGGGGVP